MQIIQKAQRPAFFVKRDGWIEPFPLDICLENNGGGSTTSGALRLTFFTPQYTKTVDAFKTGCVTAGVGNTPTVCRMGLYTVDSAGNITLVASTPNDTALFSSTWNVKALSASYKFLKVIATQLELFMWEQVEPLLPCKVLLLLPEQLSVLTMTRD